jgi:hypothetical protein
MAKINSKKKLRRVKLRKVHNAEHDIDENASEKTYKVQEVDEEDHTHSP